ncbi:hypothetical protein Q5M85_03180 [Paraclostridium bifermentans]|nr:hypothetical protein [Paraclostridium bifermentans]
MGAFVGGFSCRDLSVMMIIRNLIPIIIFTQ